jgi:hypothetical protein
MHTPPLRLWRLLSKAAALFVAANLLFAALDPLPALGRVSLYNWLVPGRTRLPYGEQPDLAYNLSLNSLEAMIAAHRLSTPKAADEFRVILLGDSSVWGVLLRPEEALDGALNALDLRRDGRRLRFYNLGYPVQALTKDVLLLDAALDHAPDLIIWLVTLEAFAPSQQTASLLVRSQPERLRALMSEYALWLGPAPAPLLAPSFLERTLVGQRRAVADWLRLQGYGLLWGATGLDQVYPPTYRPRMADFDPVDFNGDLTRWHGFTPDQPFRTDGTAADSLATDNLRAGLARAARAGVPVLLVNEPIFISEGRNSDVRYNFFYPRWAYDRYRAWLRDFSAAQEQPLLDMWDAVPPSEFTDSPVHLTSAGSRLLAAALRAVVRCTDSPSPTCLEEESR